MPRLKPSDEPLREPVRKMLGEIPDAGHAYSGPFRCPPRRSLAWRGSRNRFAVWSRPGPTSRADRSIAARRRAESLLRGHGLFSSSGPLRLVAEGALGNAATKEKCVYTIERALLGASNI